MTTRTKPSSKPAPKSSGGARAAPRPESARELLRELVRIQSVSGSESEIASFVAARLAQAGIEQRRIGNSVVARIARGRGPRFLFLSHLDTVPPGEGWSRDPFAATLERGRIIGRGANDAKASAAAMLHVFLGLAAERSRDFHGELWLALTAQEETDNSGMRAVLAEIPRPDGAVTGEPTGLEVVRAQAGLAILRARWRGRSCHSANAARVWHENALLAAAREVAKLPNWLVLDPVHPLLGVSTIVPTVLKSGARHNVVPDEAELVLDARLAPPHDAEEALALVREWLPTAQVELVSARLKAFETAEDHPLVRSALACAGRTRAFGSMTLSDMALLQGIPAVKCGPGESARSHTADEYVLESEVEAGARFYAELGPAALAALAPGARTEKGVAP